MPDGSDSNLTARTLRSLSEIDAQIWDEIATSPDWPYYPFTSYDFLSTLETSKSVCPEAGWGPNHLLLERNGKPVGAMPLYLKGNSQGEFVFDHAWADAYMRAGGRYFPKLLGAIPFTPAEGPRLLANTDEDRLTLATAAASVAQKMGVSSLHVNFPNALDCLTLEGAGYLIRDGQQYRFKDEGFGTWEGFLAALSSRKRKDLRKERQSIQDAGIEIDWITGRDIQETHLDIFWQFYQDTGARKWGSPYLTRTFFTQIAERMADKILFMFARRDTQTIAGAMNFIGGDTLYGRYWGCSEYVPFLHFELCYYQAIDFALAHGLTFVDGGAQGEHKIARGYQPVTTHSAHFIRDEGFRDAIADYLKAERDQVAQDVGFLSDYTPFRKIR